MKTILMDTNMRNKFINHMGNAVKTGILTEIEMCMNFHDKDIKLFDKTGKLLLDNNTTRARLTMLHVYDYKSDCYIVYVLSHEGNKYTVQQILEVKELYRSVVLRCFGYEVSQVLYKEVM